MTARTLAGGCLCGQVRYRAEGPALFQSLCHCRDCQRASGSGGMPVMGLARSGFHVDGAVAVYVSTGGSGQPTRRNFCPVCGSTLFGLPDMAPDLVTLYAGSLDDPTGFVPAREIFVRDRPAWAASAVPCEAFFTLPEAG